MFQQARLINAALMAKIHTIEWTPAILPHPIIKTALKTNWHGTLGDLQKVFPGINDNELLGGIPGSPTDHHTAPYTLTEEFVAVYRMHSLMPDDYTVRVGATRSSASSAAGDVRPGGARCSRVLLRDLFYSFGVAHPGRCGCTTSRAPADAGPRQGRAASTSRPSTSCAIASAACRATTGSAGCCARSR